MSGQPQMPNWGIKKLISIILAVQLAVIGLSVLAGLGLDIPVLRQAIGFIYLTFVPGLLILRVLRLRELGSIETILYSVGLSLASIMFLGFLINMFYPLIGISEPISLYPVVTTITVFTLVLSGIAYQRGRSESQPQRLDSPFKWSELLSPPVLSLLLLPVLSALGAQLVYLHLGNGLLLILLAGITLAVVLVTWNEFIPARFYPLALVTIGVALLWHWSLISPGFFGYDIQHEYIAQGAVLSNGSWDYATPGLVTGMLSIVMLAPIYSLVLNLDAVWLFKIIYPLLYSLVPLALFQAYRKQTGDKVAFLAAFLFMSMPVFFSQMLGLNRQQIAELFLALSLLLFLDKQMEAPKRAALLVIFGLSIVISHYGVSYIYMMYLLAALFLVHFVVGRSGKEMWARLTAGFGRSRPADSLSQARSPARSTVSSIYVLLFIVFCLAWYMYVSSGSIFATAVGIGKHVSSAVITDLLAPEARDPSILQALGLASMRAPDIEWSIARIFQYIIQFFVVAGIIGLIANWRKKEFHPEYTALCLVSMAMLALSVILPYFASSLTMTRIYHLTLIFLSPLCVLGGQAVFHWLRGILSLRRPGPSAIPLYPRLVTILVLAPYFLFTTGFIFQLTGATPGSMPLSLYEGDWLICTNSEAETSQWVEQHLEDDAKIYVDEYGGMMLRYRGMREGMKQTSLALETLPDELVSIQPSAYIFLRRWNLAQNKARIVEARYSVPTTRYIKLDRWIEPSSTNNRIYDSGQTKVLRVINPAP